MHGKETPRCGCLDRQRHKNAVSMRREPRGADIGKHWVDVGAQGDHEEIGERIGDMPG